MQIFSWEEFLNKSIKTDQPVSFTIGVFDGVHLGHKQLLRKLYSNPETLTVIATFKENPFLTLRPKLYQGDLFTLKQKIEYLKESGCDILVLIDFSLKFSKLSGKDFFGYIKKHLNLSHVVLGRDHKLGNDGDTTAEMAKKMLYDENIFVDIVEPMYYDLEPISSTRIRKALKKGDLFLAEKLLGRKHCLDLSSTDILLNCNNSVLRKLDIKQVVPFSGEYAVMLNNGKKTFATRIDIDEDRIHFRDLPDFKVESLTFNGF